MFTGTAAAGHIQPLLDERTRANRQFFDREAARLAQVCHLMAERFARGGRLVAVGRSPAARSDARHVAVEFVHPVIVGKRALPALGLAGEGGNLSAQVGLVGRPDDIVIGFEADDPEVAGALRVARDRGCLTLAFAAGSGAEHEFLPPSPDPSVRQELVETLYHVLWELVHVFFEHRGLLSGRHERTHHNAGASSFLYPFLDERENELQPVLDDVARSVLMKSEEVGALRAQTLGENDAVLRRAGGALRECFARGGQLLALGNGGSATDAMDAVADFRATAGRWQARAAIDLTEDAGIITAIANDIGVEAIFLRQVIAYGSAGDALLALSTSGNSANVIAALDQARRRGLVTVAMVGYDGGRIASEALADHVVVTRSEHIPRIQEAQASAYHVLRELVG
ncbi:MAG: D-sedoheptulose 7-phosphate isomerase [Solirubrobacteraceae bacterium]|jgi:D-sedoheptulose 7-phosphate isomerase|nr:D-sedoheptulose 7-phosphate isomerase [Solirubrobacteraceae bacterium]